MTWFPCRRLSLGRDAVTQAASFRSLETQRHLVSGGPGHRQCNVGAQAHGSATQKAIPWPALESRTIQPAFQSDPAAESFSFFFLAVTPAAWGEATTARPATAEPAAYQTHRQQSDREDARLWKYHTPHSQPAEKMNDQHMGA